MKKRSVIIFPIAIVLIGIFAGIIFFLQNNRQTGIKINQSELVGNDKDEHGCIASAGYSWCELKQKCLRVWEEPCEDNSSDEEMIKEALIAKHGWNPDEITLTISKNDGQYATGGVGAKTPQGGGGLWFAAKVNGNWQIVSDGNGVTMCSDLSDYPDFPASLIPQCFDSVAGEMVQR